MHELKEWGLPTIEDSHRSSEASSSAIIDLALAPPGKGNPQVIQTSEPPFMQRVLFALKTIKASLSQSPCHRALLVVSACNLRQFSHYLQSRLGPVVHICTDPTVPTTNYLSGHPFKLLITSTAVCSAVLAASCTPLSSFHVVIVDQDLGADVLDSSVQDLIYQWQRCPQRPIFIDLFSLGKQQPKLSMEDVAGSSSASPHHAPASEEAATSDGEGTDSHEGLEGKEEGDDRRSAPPRKPLPYPYATESAELTVLNSSSVFMQYCVSLLGPNVDEMGLFKYSRWKKHRSNVLCAIHYPSPDGYIKMTKRQAQKALKGRSLEQLCARDNTAGISRGDLQERWFFFVVVMDMIAHGLLDDALRPAPHVLAACRAQPPLGPATDAQRRSPPGPATDAQRHSPPGLAAPAVHRIPPTPAAGARTPAAGPDPAISEEDPQALLRHLAAGTEGLRIVYDTVHLADQGLAQAYLTTVYLQHRAETFSLRGEVSSRQSAAEHSAAIAAVKFIMRGGLGALGAKEPPPSVTLPVSVGSPPPGPLAPLPAMPPGAVPPGPVAPPLLLPGPALLTLATALGALPPVIPKPPKAQLQELVARIGQVQKCPLALRFTSLPLLGGFIGTAHLTGGTGEYCAFTGELALTPEQSEDLAAQRALCAFSCLQP